MVLRLPRGRGGHLCPQLCHLRNPYRRDLLRTIFCLVLLGEFDALLCIFRTRFLDDTLLRPVPTPPMGYCGQLYIAYVTDFFFDFDT